MAIIDSRKVDYLWKKLGYGRSKTDVNSIKNATNESIPSPLFIRGDLVWAQSDVIPAVIPSSSLEAVQVYPTTSPVECVGDITASPNRTWKTNSIDWIPPELGDTYQVKVYVHTSGDAANAASNGDQLFAAGSGNNDEWFFDYQSGLLHFIGTNLPNGINFSGKSIYVSGARYTGIKGVPAPGAAITFSSVGVGSHFSVTGFSTFTNTVDINNGAYIDNIQIGITGDNEIDTTTGNLIIDSFEGTVTVDDRLIVVGLSTFNSDVDFDSNVNIDSTLTVTGLSTFQNNVHLLDNDKIELGTSRDLLLFSNGSDSYIYNTVNSGNNLILQQDAADLDVVIKADTGSGGGVTDYFLADGSTGEVVLYHYGSQKFATKSSGIDVTGITETDDLKVTGVSTFTGNIDANGDLDVDGYTELDTVNVSEKLNVVGVSTFGSDLDINASVNISTNLDVDGVSTFGSDLDINADVDISGELVVDGTSDLDHLNVAGLSTFASNVDINADLDVDGYTELDTVNISEKLNVVGVSTFGSDLDINASVNISTNLDVGGELVVDGTSDLDHLNVAGLSTFASNVDINADLDVSGHTELDNVNVSENVLVAGVVTATSFHTGAEGSAIRINSSTITGPANLTIDPAGVGDNTGLVIIAGDLQVDGTQTIINSTSVTIDDLNIMLADGAANDAAADGGGFTVQSGDGNKTFQFEATGDNFGSSEHINLATGKTLKIANTEVLRSDLLTVANAALSGVTTVGTTLDVNGDLDVDGYTELDTTNISEALNVVGLTTLGSNVDINADLDVDGNTELDGLNVDGTTTLDGTTIDGTLVVNGDIDLSGDIDIDGYTELDTVNVSEKLNVVGVSTFGSDLDINASVNISTNLDVVGDLDVDGYTELDTVNISEKLNVVGVSTFGSDLDINASVNISTNLDVVGDLDVDGYTELDTVNVSEKLNVVGVSTFGSDLDINASVNISTNLDVVGDLDVDGATTLDTTTIDGVLTVNTGEIHANAGLTVNTAIVEDLTDNRVVIVGTGGELEDDANLTFDGSTLSVGVNLDVDGATTLDDTTIDGTLTLNGSLDLSNGIDVDGTSDLDHLNVAGLSTFASNIDINADVDISGELVVDGTSDLDHLNVAGLSTFTGNIDANGNLDVDGITNLDTLNVAELATFSANIDANGDLDVDGTTELDVLNVAETATFSSNIDANGDLDVDGTTELDVLNVAELATFSANIDANGNVDISGELVVDGTSDLDHLNVTGIATISDRLDVNGDLHDIAGTIALDNVDVSGIVSATKFDGDLNALGNTYYVATTGSDSNSGDNINEPYLTVAKALTVATSGDIVYVGAGVFDETCPLTVPSGVTVKGAGLRATTIRPTTATKTNNVFLLSDVSTLEDFTIKGSYYDSTNDTGYAFSYASGITIATRSPYIQRVTVLNRGSVVTADDPYGFDTADSPPTSHMAGRGAKVDGSLVTSSSIEAGMLFNEVTFFTPNNKGVILTNGARAEYLNCFHYFASQAIVGEVGTTGIGGNANTRLKFSNPNVTPVANDVVKLYNGSGVGIATGTIVTYSSDYATISGLGIGTFTSVGAGTTQDVRFFQSDGTTQKGVADSILLADYTMFGAEMRSVGCAVEYGTQGVVADGNGVKLRMFATNFNHVGSGKDFSNDTTLTIQANEVVELNSGQVSYVSIDQGGDFRVGDALFIDQETGNVSFAATSYSLDVTGTIDVTDGTNTSTLTPTSITVGGLQLASNQLSSLSGDITIDPSGSSKTVVQGNLDVNGTLNASVVNIDAIQRGDTSISITDTGTDGTIIFYTENSEAFRIDNTQTIVFTGAIDANNATIDNLTFTSGTAITSVDTDLASVSASDDTLASAKAIKTYVDAQVTAQDLDITGDTGTGAVDLDSQSLTVAGTANEIETSVSNQTITVGLPDDITVSTSLTVGSNTILVDAGIVAGIITATSFVGPITGAVTGDVTGNLTGDVTGNLTGSVTDTSGTSSFNNVTVSGIVTSNAGFAGTVLSKDGTGYVLVPGASVNDTSQLYNTNLYDSLGRVVTNMVADQIHWAGVADGLTGIPPIHVGVVTAHGQVESTVGFAGTVLSQDGTGYVLIPGASANDTSQLYNTNLYNDQGQVVTNMVADAVHFAGVADGLTGTPDIKVGIVTATHLQVTGVSTFANTQVSTSVASPVFNTDHSSIGSIEFITTGTAAVTGHILDGTAFRSVEYLIQAVDGANMHLTKILAIHDGAGAVMTTEYGTVFNNSPLASYDMVMNGPNAELMITAATPAATTYKITFTAIAI